jgi:2-polyprenyl-3-methyl-5-hydroxy-6-metoxy-1,4-benzoquinol methylase
MNWDYNSHYATFHPDTDEHRDEMSEQMRRWLGPHLPADPDTAVLDIGCGHGYALSALQRLGFKNIRGVDVDAGQVERARAANLAVELVADTVRWLSERPAAFGLILLLDVLEHVEPHAQPAFLMAVRGALRPGASLVLTVPNAAASLALYWRHIDYTHRISFTVPSLRYLLLNTGFEKPQFHSIELAPASWTARAILQRVFRLHRRLEFMAEFGQAGRAIPVTPNLLAVAERPC